MTVTETIRTQILSEDHPLLRTVSAPITEFTEEVRGLAFAMVGVIEVRGALGLAAVQIGSPVRLIVVRLQAGVIVAMANPRIVRTLKRDVVAYEGCLSVPEHKWRPIARPGKCDIIYQDLEGFEREMSFAGTDARAVLHEIDHLDGILMTDKPEAETVH